jgi:ankyrin repeat protein
MKSWLFNICIVIAFKCQGAYIEKYDPKENNLAAYEEQQLLYKIVKAADKREDLLRAIKNNNIVFFRNRSKYKDIVIDDIIFLQKALLLKHYEIVECLAALIKEETSLNAPDNDGKTLLHTIIESSDTLKGKDFMNAEQILLVPLNILLNHKANPCVADKTGKTPLHVAALKGYYYMCETLIHAQENLQQEADAPKKYVNLQDNEGNTPLHLLFQGTYNQRAQPNNAASLINFLIEKGANPSIKNKKGQSIQDYQQFQLLEENKMITSYPL